MNKYVKSFLHRGLVFGGLGPIVLGIVYALIERSIDDFSLSGAEVLIGIVSVYFLAFIQAGATVFNQIEEWPVAKSLLFHFLSLYVAYIACYTLNSWIPFYPMAIVIFTAIFVISYIVIWLTVYLIVKKTQNNLNSKIHT